MKALMREIDMLESTGEISEEVADRLRNVCSPAKDEIAAEKDPVKRRAMIAENIHLFADEPKNC